MATAKIWKNVAVSMQSAIAGAKTISGITKAAPGVVSSTTHGYSNGDYVLLSVQGMSVLDGMVFRVANVATDTFQLEGPSGGTGIDTSGFDTFTSGTAQKITFGTSLSTVTTLSSSGGDFNFIDTTTIHSNVKTQMPGMANPISYNFENIWDVSDAGMVAMKAASDAQAMRAFKFTFGTGGSIVVFAGYVGATAMPTGAAQGMVTSPATITMYGRPSTYAS